MNARSKYLNSSESRCSQSRAGLFCLTHVNKAALIHDDTGSRSFVQTRHIAQTRKRANAQNLTARSLGTRICLHCRQQNRGCQHFRQNDGLPRFGIEHIKRHTITPKQNIAKSNDGVVLESPSGRVSAASFVLNTVTKVVNLERLNATYQSAIK